MIRRPPRSTRTDTLFPYTTLFRSIALTAAVVGDAMRSQRQVVDANPDALARIEWSTDVIQMPLVTIGHVIAGFGRFAYVFGQAVARRGGKECVRTCSFRGASEDSKKKL